jgi:hypothetical protein
MNNMSVAEIRGWAEYFTYVADMEKQANQRARGPR